MWEENLEEVQKYSVDIETSNGVESIPIIASSMLDLYEQASETEDFIRVLNINE